MGQSRSGKTDMEDLLKTMEKDRKAGCSRTLLGIGPMSWTVIRAAFEIGREDEIPLLFIASRNQVDADDLGGGYVLGWNQERFCAALEHLAWEVGYEGPYFVCRDHGGPWQRDNERAAKLPPEEAMRLAMESYRHDIMAGFDLLHIDPTKDPHLDGTVPLDLVLVRTIELIAFVEGERRRQGLQRIAYEVGTEETAGGLIDPAAFDGFLRRLLSGLKSRDLPVPAFIVGQTGTLVKMRRNVGRFNRTAAVELARIAATHGVGFKEHNADYLPADTLAAHPGLGITAANVAPEFGVAETSAYLSLARLETELAAAGRIKEPSAFTRVLLAEAFASRRWRKWLTPDLADRDEERLHSDPDTYFELAVTCGHYVYDLPSVVEQKERLFANLKSVGADPGYRVTAAVKKAIHSYITAFRLSNAASPPADRSLVG